MQTSYLKFHDFVFSTHRKLHQKMRKYWENSRSETSNTSCDKTTYNDLMLICIVETKLILEKKAYCGYFEGLLIQNRMEFNSVLLRQNVLFIF
jgi:hypothetical protein